MLPLNYGKHYRHRAFELINACQLFSVASRKHLEPYTKLLDVLRKCDIAIGRAITLRDRDYTDIDYYFAIATRVLCEYEETLRQSNNTLGSVLQRMDDAEKEDKKISLWSQSRTFQEVTFHIRRTLPVTTPIIVQQTLSSSYGPLVLPEIIWNFFHFKPNDERRLTLAQNPHFYTGLPTSPNEYGGRFTKSPTRRFEGTIHVLTNNSSHIFLEFGENLRAFDNVWTMDNTNTLIFKDVVGTLESQARVRESIQGTPPFRHVMYPAENRIEETEDWGNEDWGNIIRQLKQLEVLYDSIHITCG